MNNEARQERCVQIGKAVSCLIPEKEIYLVILSGADGFTALTSNLSPKQETIRWLVQTAIELMAAEKATSLVSAATAEKET